MSNAVTFVGSLLLMAAPIAVWYGIIRPRLKARYTELFTEIDSFWARQWARIKALRSFVIATVGAFAAALPEVLQTVAGVDFSFLPHPWPMWVSVGVSVTLTLNRAYSTTPPEGR